MERNSSRIVEHLINIFLICILSFLGLALLMLYRTEQISTYVVPFVDGKASYADIDIESWLSAFGNLVCIMVGIVFVFTILRYIIESLAVTYEKTVLRSVLFTLIVFILEVICTVFFIKVKAPIVEGDTKIILIYSIATTLLYYILIVGPVPSGIRFLLFPRNLLAKRR